MTLQEKLRDGLNQRMKRCPTCGTTTRTLRDMSKVIGASPATLCRFLAGKPASGDVLDKIDAFLRQFQKDKR